MGEIADEHEARFDAGLLPHYYFMSANKRQGFHPMPRPVSRVVARKPARKSATTRRPASSSREPDRGLGIFLYGPSGVGKTSLVSYFDDCGFIIDSQEEGIRDLIEFKQCNPKARILAEVDTWEGLFSAVDEASSAGIKTLGLDSATGFEKLCFVSHCERNFNGDWSKEGFYSYQQGPKAAAKTDWPQFLDLLDHVRRNGINVVLIGHSQVKTVGNPEGSDYDQYIPYLDKETWAQTHRWAQSVLFLNYNIVVKKTDGKRKADMEQSGGRLLYADPSPAFNAKNRYGLESPIDLGENAEEGYANFAAALETARRK